MTGGLACASGGYPPPLPAGRFYDPIGHRYCVFTGAQLHGLAAGAFTVRCDQSKDNAGAIDYQLCLVLNAPGLQFPFQYGV